MVPASVRWPPSWVSLGSRSATCSKHTALERAELQEERQTLSRAGFDRFATYLTARHAAGVTVTAVAAELGHTAAWVRIRARRDGLTALTRPPPQALSRARQRAVDHGFASLEDYVGHRYGVDGVTARQLKAELGLRPEQVARLLDACGVERRDDPDVAERRCWPLSGSTASPPTRPTVPPTGSPWCRWPANSAAAMSGLPGAAGLGEV